MPTLLSPKLYIRRVLVIDALDANPTCFNSWTLLFSCIRASAIELQPLSVIRALYNLCSQSQYVESISPFEQNLLQVLDLVVFVLQSLS